MTSTTQYIPFPNGVTVFQSKKDAKNLKKTSSFSHTEALNEIAKKNGINKSWDDAITLLKITNFKNQPLTSEEQDLKNKLTLAMSLCCYPEGTLDDELPTKNTVKNNLLQQLISFMQEEFGGKENAEILTTKHFEDTIPSGFPLKLIYPISLLASQFFYKCAIEVTERYISISEDIFSTQEILARDDNVPEYFGGDPSNSFPFYLRRDKSIGLILVGRSYLFKDIARAKDYRQGKKDVVELYEAGFALNEAELGFQFGEIGTEQMNALLLSGKGLNLRGIKIEDLDFALIFKQKLYSTTPNGMERRGSEQLDYVGCYDVGFLYVNTLDYVREYLDLLTKDKSKAAKVINAPIKTFLRKVLAKT